MRRYLVISLMAILICSMCISFTGVYANENSDVETQEQANSWRYSNGVLIEDSSDKMMRSTSSHPDATLRGIDVSEFQHVINWEKVKAAGIDFAIIRCGYGMNQTDQDDAQFERNASECERLGIPYGVYIYSYATSTASASSEADHVLRLIKGHTLSYPVYFDMEDKSTLKSNHAAIANTFCSKIEKAGYPVGVYANLNWWNNYLTDPVFSKWHRWVAQYYSYCQYEGEYAMWQYTSSGYVNGISGRVDMNYQIGYPEDHGYYDISGSVDIEDGYYMLLNVKNNNYAITGTNNKVSINNGESYLEQKYHIQHVSDGYYKIENVSTGKVLTASGSTGAKQLYVTESAYKGSDSQLWCFIEPEEGKYVIKSKLGNVISVTAGTFQNGTSVSLNRYKNNAAQKWNMEKTDITFLSDAESVSGDNVNRIFNSSSIARCAGNNRYETAILSAELLKTGNAVSTFDNIIVASGENYPDALAGSYLARVKNAPILLVDSLRENELAVYIYDNLSKNGTVYILGGTGAVSKRFEELLQESATVKRLEGYNRYETNIAILNEADYGDKELIVCTGEAFADSLSAAAIGKPVLLVEDMLSKSQKSYIEKMLPEKIFIVGGTGAVSKSLENECSQYAQTTRISGYSRYTTSTAVGYAFFGESNENAVLAYAHNYPDGLSGSSLALSINAPVVLTDNSSNYALAANYVKNTGVKKAVVMGGTSLISDTVINGLLQYER